MILGIDVGNTNVVLGILEDGKILKTVRMRTESGATSAEHAIKISDLLPNPDLLSGMDSHQLRHILPINLPLCERVLHSGYIIVFDKP